MAHVARYRRTGCCDSGMELRPRIAGQNAGKHSARHRSAGCRARETMKTAMTTGNRFFRRRTAAKRKTRSVTRALLFTALAVTMAPCGAQQPGPHDAEFRAFYAEFVAAVRANDKNKLADLIAFPVKDWSVEHKGNVETIGIK